MWTWPSLPSKISPPVGGLGVASTFAGIVAGLLGVGGGDILPFTSYFAPLGARLAHALEPKWVKRAFDVFLVLTTIKILHSSLT